MRRLLGWKRCRRAEGTEEGDGEHCPTHHYKALPGLNYEYHILSSHDRSCHGGQSGYFNFFWKKLLTGQHLEILGGGGGVKKNTLYNNFVLHSEYQYHNTSKWSNILHSGYITIQNAHPCLWCLFKQSHPHCIILWYHSTLFPSYNKVERLNTTSGQYGWHKCWND